jgi:hypothetical protein
MDILGLLSAYEKFIRKLIALIAILKISGAPC